MSSYEYMNYSLFYNGGSSANLFCSPFYCYGRHSELKSSTLVLNRNGSACTVNAHQKCEQKSLCVFELSSSMGARMMGGRLVEVLAAVRLYICVSTTLARPQKLYTAEYIPKIYSKHNVRWITYSKWHFTCPEYNLCTASCRLCICKSKRALRQKLFLTIFLFFFSNINIQKSVCGYDNRDQ